MGKIIVVTSGKGGVGKTTSTAALGAALARGGQRVAVVDFDVGLRNLDLVMGAERRGGGGPPHRPRGPPQSCPRPCCRTRVSKRSGCFPPRRSAARRR